MALVPPPVTQPASAEIGTVDRVTITQTRKAVIHVIRPQGWGDAEITLAVANRMPDLIARAEWWDAEVETDGASIAKSTDDRKMESEDGGPRGPTDASSS